MEKIKNTLKNLYRIESAKDTHLKYLLLMVLPVLVNTILQSPDDDFKEFVLPTLLTGLVLFIIAIPFYLSLIGIFAKFINNRFSTELAFPNIDIDCIKKGWKIFPLYLCWGAYASLYTLFFIVLFVLIITVMAIYRDSLFFFMSGLAAIFLIFVALIVSFFLITPFVNLIFIKYSKNFEYSKDLFNPITPFRYMSKCFVPTIIVSLKYLLVGFIAEFVVIIAAIILSVIGGIGLFICHIPLCEPHTLAGLIQVCTLGFLFGLACMYISQITSLGCTDNMIEIYKEKLETTE